MAEADVGYYTSDTDGSNEEAQNEGQYVHTNRSSGDKIIVDDVLDKEFFETAVAEDRDGTKPYKWEIVPKNVAYTILFHTGAIIGLYFFIFQVKWATFFWTIALAVCGALGITAGAHRLWCHRTYKAKLPLRLILLAFNNIAFQNSVITWVRDHRAHHKFTETDADPHNARRGFFFSHIGWLLVRKHEAVKSIGKKVSVDDLWKDPLLVFQHNHYLMMLIIFSAVIPTVIPMYFWGETFLVSFTTAGFFRYVSSLHYTWCVNSVAHLFGHRPYDKNIFARQSIWTSLVALGEGWHNFHHKFPRDYRASEYPAYWFNPTKSFIDFFAWIGWAYDLQRASPEAIARMKLRLGDGSD